MKQTNVVTMLTENPNGVLGRIIALFGRHGVAIDSLSVSATGGAGRQPHHRDYPVRPSPDPAGPAGPASGGYPSGDALEGGARPGSAGSEALPLR